MPCLRWWDTSTPLRQLAQCGKKTVAALAASGVKTLDDVLSADPRALERIVRRPFPYGATLMRQVRELPRQHSVRLLVVTCTPRMLTVEVRGVCVRVVVSSVSGSHLHRSVGQCVVDASVTGHGATRNGTHFRWRQHRRRRRAARWSAEPRRGSCVVVVG